MATSVDICNLALSKIGARKISSLSDALVEAEACNLHYPFARDAALEDHDWSFARKRATLAESVDTVEGWDYVYAYPSDCICAREISKESSAASGEDPIEFEVSPADALTSKRILTNTEDAVLIYTAQVTTVNMFTPNFIDALSWRLAAELAVVLRGSPDLYQVMMTRYEFTRAKASALSSNEEQRKPDEVNTFANARLG